MRSSILILISIIAISLKLSAQPVVSGGACNSGGTQVVLTLNTTGSTFLSVVGSAFGTVSLADSKGNTWTTAITKVGTGTTPTQTIFYCWNSISVGASHTFTVTTANVSPTVAVEGWSTINVLSDPLDKTNGNFVTGGARTSLSTLSTGTLSQANEVAISGSYLLGDVDATLTVDNSAVISSHGQCTPTAPTYGICHLIVSSTSALTFTWSWTTSVSNSVVTIATFKTTGTSTNSGMMNFFMKQ